MKAHVDPVGGAWMLERKRRCPFTRFETCLLCLCLFLLCSLISVCCFWLFFLDGRRVFTEGLAAWKAPSTPTLPEFGAFNESLGYDKSAVHNSRLVCTSRECAHIAAFFASNLNEKVNPCEDFYGYACGNYGLTRELPANKPLRHTIIDAQALLHKQIRSTLEAPAGEQDKPWDRLAKDYYKKCLDEDELAASGKDAIISLLDQVGGWPVLEGRNWTAFDDRWEEYIADVLNKTGVSAVLLELTISHDPNNSSKTSIELDQPKFGIGSRWPYMGGINETMVQNYTELMIRTAVSLGADEAAARREMLEAVQFEIKLVDFSSDDTIRRDPDRSNNPFQLWQLRKMFPLIDFDAYLRRSFRDIVEVSENDTLIIREIDYFRGLQHVMNSTSKRVIANYVAWRVVQGFSPFLPPKDRSPFYDFKANQTGMFDVPAPERWEDCVTLSIMLFDMPVGKLFVENFFDEKFAMPKVTEMTAFLKKTFIHQLNKLDWMDPGTKERAIRKANAIEYKSGYPATLFNDSWMHANWGFNQTTRHESLLDFTVRVKLRRTVDELARYKQPIDRGFWYQSPAQVDAFYAPNLNEMIFPAGIMQFPFLSSGVPNYVTYAMVGAVISHELSHAFDDQARPLPLRKLCFPYAFPYTCELYDANMSVSGGRYDEFGNLNDWWDIQTAEKFYNKAECFVHQYQNERIKEIGGQKLNGRLSLGENIADNGGIKTAYKAYRSWREASPELEPALPGFQNFTSEQIFFIAYANNWCSMINPRYVGQLIHTDVHAPASLRATIPLRNRGEFAAAFQCPPDSPMNPAKKCEIW
ncbi:Protein NEP-21 a [Aphelenchoides avenae]|nr:Protein NEP-21 a [Aphelenchus avenae]